MSVRYHIYTNVYVRGCGLREAQRCAGARGLSPVRLKSAENTNVLAAKKLPLPHRHCTCNTKLCRCCTDTDPAAQKLLLPHKQRLCHTDIVSTTQTQDIVIKADTSVPHGQKCAQSRSGRSRYHSKMLFEVTSRRLCGDTGTGPMNAVYPLYFVLHCSVHLYARVHPSI